MTQSASPTLASSPPDLGLPKKCGSDHLCSPVALHVRLRGSHQAATGAVRTSHVVERKRLHYTQDCHDSASVFAPVKV